MIIIPFFLFFLIVVVESFSRLDPDLGWHLYLGQKMVESKTLITNTIGYNYFHYLNLPDHEWLSDIILYSLSKIGVWTIVLFFFLITCALAFLLYKIAQKQSTSPSIVLTGLLLTTLSLSLAYGLRLQVFLFLTTAWFIYINQYIVSHKIRYWLYFMITVIGTNLHGGFLTVLPVPLLLEFPLNRPKDWTTTNYRAWFVLFFILFGGLLINPYGLKYWQLVANYSTNPYYLMHIQEWLPIYSAPFHFSNVILPLSLMIFCFSINNYWRKLPLKWILLFVLYGFLALKFIRYFPIFAIIALPMLISALEDLKVNILLNKKNKYFLLLVSIALLVSIVFVWNSQNSSQRLRDPFSDEQYPALASQFLKENPLSEGNLLNPYGWGGYLLWQNPSIKIFIDGRGPQKIISDKTSLLEEYYKFNDGNKKKITLQLKKYNISSVLIDKTEYRFDLLDSWLIKIGRINYTGGANFINLTDYLKNSPDWKKVYEDNISAVYFKK